MLDSVSGSFGLRFALAALVVGLALAAFFAAASYFRKRSSGGFFTRGSFFGDASFLSQGRSRRSRIRVVETVVIDARRRVLLIQRDNVEHLVMIGGPSDLVIEQGIETPYEAAETEEDGYDAQSGYHDDTGHEDEEYDRHEAPEPVRAIARAPAAADADNGEFREGLRPLRGERSLSGLRQANPDAPPARLYQEWEDEAFEDEDLLEQLDLGRPKASPAPTRLEPGRQDPVRLRGEPAPGTIRPVTVSRAAPSAVSDEEADIASKLEAARRRSQAPGPRAPVPPQGPGAGRDFDAVLAREMEERLEAAKQLPRPVVQQQRRDPNLPRITGAEPEQRNLQSGLTRIFGETNRRTDQ